MKIKKKLVKLNTSMAVILPQDWLRDREKAVGHPVIDVEMDINGVIKIQAV